MRFENKHKNSKKMEKKIVGDMEEVGKVASLFGCMMGISSTS